MTMAVSQAAVLDALRRIKGPELQGNIVDLGLVSEILVKDGRVYFSITVPPERAAELEPLRQAAEKVVAGVAGVDAVTAVLTAEAKRGDEPARRESARVAAARSSTAPTSSHSHSHSHPPSSAPTRTASGGAGQPKPQASASRGAQRVQGVRHLIAVASGKGGVGKSTTAVNLALGLQAIGLRVGILDADIYGPSQPRLLGLSGRPRTSGGKLEPLAAYGLKVMSMGFMVDEATPVIWRGPMVVSALQQMLREVAWADDHQPLDCIVIDMPPGTGDIQLSMAQQVPLSGAIIVSTPQDLALIDARKGLAMFRQVDVPVLGIIENMSYFLCPKCGERSDIFGHGGAHEEADRLGLPFLGEVPLHMDIRALSDSGRPVTATMPDSIHAQIFRDIAARAWSALEQAQGQQVAPPMLEVEDEGRALHVAFADGEGHRLSAEMLRVMSPSAEVQGHSPDQRVTVAGKRNVRIRDLRAVGNYATRIGFDDGHDTGLFTWSYLLKLGREKDQRWAIYLDELKAKGLGRG